MRALLRIVLPVPALRHRRIATTPSLPHYHARALLLFFCSPLPRPATHNTVMPAGDIFVYGGDMLFVSRWYHESTKAKKMTDFNEWLGTHVNCPVVLCIGGNHDDLLQSLGRERAKSVLTNVTHYIENNSVTVGNLRFFGSPASEGRSHNRAFQSEDFRKAAQDASQSLHVEVQAGGEPIDVFISHGPEVSAPSELPTESPLQFPFPLDRTAALRHCGMQTIYTLPFLARVLTKIVVSPVPHRTLQEKIVDLLAPRVHLWGHVHQLYGVSHRATKTMKGSQMIPTGTLSVNASAMDHTMSPTNPPIVVDVLDHDLAKNSGTNPRFANEQPILIVAPGSGTFKGAGGGSESSASSGGSPVMSSGGVAMTGSGAVGAGAKGRKGSVQMASARRVRKNSQHVL